MVPFGVVWVVWVVVVIGEDVMTVAPAVGGMGGGAETTWETGSDAQPASNPTKAPSERTSASGLARSVGRKAGNVICIRDWETAKGVHSNRLSAESRVHRKFPMPHSAVS